MHFSDIIVLHHEPVSLLPKLKQALQQYGKEFKYSGHPHDKQGIIYWLGTRKGTLKKWTNPILGKQMDIEARNIRFDGEHLTAHRFFETYETGHVQIAAKAPHFNLILIVKLHPSHILVKPSAYTLGYYKGGSGACMLRNWTFSGSTDGVNWDVLKKHVKDESITIDSAFTWHLDSTKKYNQFKIERTGVVSGGDTHYYTAFSGLEIYGTVCKTANKSMAHVHIIAKMVAKEGKSEELVQILNNLVETTRTESGTLSYDVYRSKDKQNEFTFVEEYDSLSALKIHGGNLSKVLPTIQPLLAGPVEILKMNKIASKNNIKSNL